MSSHHRAGERLLLQVVAWGMAAGVVLLVTIASLVGPIGSYPLPDTVTWILAGLAVAAITVGTMLAVTTGASAPAFRTRVVVSLALREMGGFLGAVLTLLGADLAWALGLGGLALVSIVTLIPKPPAEV